MTLIKNVEIDIDKYLSEDDKKYLAKELFSSELRKGFLEKKPSSNKSNTENYERVIYNAVYAFLEETIDREVGLNHKELIHKKVTQLFNKPTENWGYSVFKRKSSWEKEDSLAIQYIDEAVKEHRDVIKAKVKEHIDSKLKSLSDDYFDDLVNDLVQEVIKEKLTT